MLKGITLFLVGAVIGAGVLYGVTWGFGLDIFRGREEVKETTQTSQPVSQNTPSETPQPPTQSQLNQLQTQLFQTGVTIPSLTVTKVYPGAGFIVKDNSGTSLFVQWTQTEPQVDQIVQVKGIVRQVASSADQLKGDGYTPELQQFLSGQQIFLKASDVNTQS